MNLRRISASVTIALAVALAIGSSLYSHPERANNARESIVLPTYDPALASPRRDVTVFSEDFENNAEGWETADLSNLTAAFHASSFMADDHNNHWWAGDTIEGYATPYYGYDNRWLNYLDSPVLNLAAASENVALDFRARWLMEDPRPHPPPDGWDGWDGWMVLVSTDGGQNFEVMRPTSPAYTAEHISSAERFWMLQGDWPGWVYESKAGGMDAWDAVNDTTPEPEWVDCNFDLSRYRSENVVIRFMIVSDKTVSAVFSGEGMANRYLANSGVLVDDIFVRDGENVILSNNADDDPVPSDMIPRVGPGSGDTWALTRQDVHTGTFAMWNDDDNFNLINPLDSPPFHIPQGGNTHLEYWVHSDLPDAVHAGQNQLQDFYQVYISNDDGATWTYFYHDWNRAEAGADGWVRYMPGVPISGNTDLSFEDYLDQDIRLRWLFWTDNDHTEGNGTGLFLDDIQVINENRMPRDAGFENLYVGYPLRVNVRKTGISADLINFGTNNLNPIHCYWGWYNEDYHDSTFIRPYPSIPAGDTTTVPLSDFVVANVRGWTPEIPGPMKVWAASALGSRTEPVDDDDQVTENDSTFVFNKVFDVMVWPTDIAELGYDNRSIHFAYEFARGQGPAVRFSPEDAEMDNYAIGFAQIIFNGGQQADAQIRLHVLGQGQDDSTPGAEIGAVDVVVTPQDCLPNGMMIDLSALDIHFEAPTDFWLWVEVTEEGGRPQFAGDQQLRGEGRFFNYSMGQAAAFNADLMIHAGIIPGQNRGPNLVGVEEFFDLGEVAPNESVQKFFTLYSTGILPVTIENVSINENSYEVFWEGPVTLSVGEYVRFSIIFTPPDDGVHIGDMIIASNDDSPPVITVAGGGMVGVADEKPVTPNVFALSAPYPNPFNSLSRFNFNLASAGFATVTLHDLSGREVAVVASGMFGPGVHAATVRGLDLPTGLYLLKLQSNGLTAVQKIALMK